MRRTLLVWMFVLISTACWAENQFKIIPLQHRFAQELLPALQPLAGPEGAISASGSNLFVDVAPERMAIIEQAIARLDVESRMYRIRVSRSSESSSGSNTVDVQGGIGNEVRIERSGPRRSRNGVTVEVERRETTTRTRGSEFLNVLDGSRAFIAVGQSVPYTEYWATFIRRYASIHQAVRYRDITTGFSVLPRQVGQEVELEITPRISSSGSAGIVDFEELSTTVRVVPGTWLNLGGTLQNRDEVSRAILSRESERSSGSSGLWVLVEPQ